MVTKADYIYMYDPNKLQNMRMESINHYSSAILTVPQNFSLQVAPDLHTWNKAGEMSNLVKASQQHCNNIHCTPLMPHLVYIYTTTIHTHLMRVVAVQRGPVLVMEVHQKSILASNYFHILHCTLKYTNKLSSLYIARPTYQGNPSLNLWKTPIPVERSNSKCKV